MPSLERNDRQLRLYLLGMLPEEALRVVEEQLFQDAALFERVVDLRKLLLRDYARRRLTGEEAVQLEKQLALSPELAAEASIAAKAVLSERRRAQKWLAAAAAIVVFAALAFAFLPGRRASDSAASRAVQIVPSSHPEPATTAFFLSAGATRSQSAVQQIRLPDGVSTVALQAEVRGENKGRWDAALLRGKDRLLEQNGLVVTSNNFFSYVTVVVPCSQLSPGRFALLLTPADDSSRPERIDFEVSQRH